MSKRTGPQVTNALFRSTEHKTPDRKRAAITPETSETSETAVSSPEKRKKNGAPSKQGQGGGRPRIWAEGEKTKFTTVILTRHLDVLSTHAALAKVNEGVNTDRSGVLRALIGKLERQEITLKASDFQ